MRIEPQSWKSCSALQEVTFEEVTFVRILLPVITSDFTKLRGESMVA